MSTSQTKARRCPPGLLEAFRLLDTLGTSGVESKPLVGHRPLNGSLKMLSTHVDGVAFSWFHELRMVAVLLFLRHFSLGRIGGGHAGTASNPPQGVRKGTQAISDAFTSTSNVLEGLPGVSAAPRFDSFQSYLLIAVDQVCSCFVFKKSRDLAGLSTRACLCLELK